MVPTGKPELGPSHNTERERETSISCLLHPPPPPLGMCLQPSPMMSGNDGEANHDPPQPANPGIPNQWHEDVTQDRREELVHELIQAIFPVPDPAALEDPRMANTIAYAQREEKDAYESANSREEYENLVAEKINGMQNMPPNAAAPGTAAPAPEAGA